ncbi:MAG TPA: hypothetical protein VE621_19290, partial [Bryobacteraceae bacterium]|nr:hypothetical protein [Bryobacteraceae bacterium]
MHRRLLPFALAITALSQTVPHPTGNRTTPPTLRDVQPRGIARGTTAELTLEGFNLAGAREIYFSEPGVKGKVLRVKELPDLPDIRLGSNGTPSTIDLGPLPPRNQVTVEVEVSSEANIGPVDFRVLTPLGTSPMGRVLIEPYYGEAPDREPNNQPEDGFDTYVPAILVGEISRPGDVDYYKIRVEAGQNLVFENGGAMLNSTLQPVIRIFAEDRTEVAEFLPVAGQTAFAHKFDKAGTYYVQVSDYLQSGRTGHIYRIKAGEFPVVTSAFPLGVRKGEKATLQLSGYGLAQAKAEIKGEPTSE